MKFEKTLIPVFTGVDKARQMIKTASVDDRYYISAVRPGIKCLVINGAVCDENGEPFQNQAIQERFRWFSERLQRSNFIGIGKLVLDSKTNHRNANNHGLYSLVGYRRSWGTSHYEDIFIELEDIEQPISEHKIKFDIRSKVMEGMHRSTYPDVPVVFLQEQFKGNKKSISEIIDFAFESAKEGKTVLFKDGTQPFRSGRQTIITDFEIDLFEIFQGVIESVRESEVHVNTQNKICKLVDFVRVRYENSLYPIAFMNAAPEQSAYISRMIEEGKLEIGKSLFAFKAVKGVSELKLVSKI